MPLYDGWFGLLSCLQRLLSHDGLPTFLQDDLELLHYELNGEELSIILVPLHQLCIEEYINTLLRFWRLYWK